MLVFYFSCPCFYLVWSASWCPLLGSAIKTQTLLPELQPTLISSSIILKHSLCVYRRTAWVSLSGSLWSNPCEKLTDTLPFSSHFLINRIMTEVAVRLHSDTQLTEIDTPLQTHTSSNTQTHSTPAHTVLCGNYWRSGALVCACVCVCVCPPHLSLSSWDSSITGWSLQRSGAFSTDRGLAWPGSIS